MTPRKIIVGSRGSLLALAQASLVIVSLKIKFPKYAFGLKKIITLGDRKKTWPRNSAGIFVKEIEEALLAKKIDLAVHSAKDLPSEIMAGLKLAAIPERVDPADVLISRKTTNLKKIKRGARIGTGSPRRKAQLLKERPDLIIQDLRGNLDTRIKKLNAGEFDAIVAAAAGIKRLGYPRLNLNRLPYEIMLPCPGQGALGIEIRENDPRIEDMVQRLNHPKSFLAVSCERAFLSELGAGCRLPVGALAEIKNNRIILQAVVASLDGKKIIRLKRQAQTKDAQSLGRSLAQEILKKGGDKILNNIK